MNNFRHQNPFRQLARVGVESHRHQGTAAGRAQLGGHWHVVAVLDRAVHHVADLSRHAKLLKWTRTCSSVARCSRHSWSSLPLASIFFIPLYVGIRVAAERQENNPDLLYVSTLSPARIIRGKFFCGAYMALLFFSACMPFMAFTNLLRGVDLPTVFFILFYLFPGGLRGEHDRHFFRVHRRQPSFQNSVRPVRIFPVLVANHSDGEYFVLNSCGPALARQWPNAIFGSVLSPLIGIGAGNPGLFFVLAVALISPPSKNRALPVRIYVTVIWLLGGLLNWAWVIQTEKPGPDAVWAYSTFVLMMFSLLVDHQQFRPTQPAYATYDSSITI